ncbi:TPA: IS21-like element helper ATPase IstB [Legionella pneumophila]|nr:IS21-like element helper ATPase IstB [Legionella pneumophila]HBD9283360.1 IS21-like element helper ATPase IstB [Legionella pneumophila]
MLNNPTLDKLHALKLTGMAEAFSEQLQRPLSELDFEERLGLLVEREYLLRDNRKMARRLKQAKLQQNACMEDMDYKHPRGLNKAAVLELFRCQWVQQHLNLLITGPTGCGKTYIACALAHKACLTGLTARYFRLPRLWNELKIAKASGSYASWLSAIAKVDVLILDDWGLVAPDEEQRRDLLEILEDRYQNRSTIITSQLDVSLWHEHLGDATLADAVLDRLVHNAVRIKLDGDSMRKKSLQTNEG